MMAPMSRRATNPAHFKAFVRWGLLLFSPFPVFIVLALSLQSHRWGGTLIVVVHSALSFWFGWRMVDAVVTPDPWKRMGGRTALFTLATAAATALLTWGPNMMDAGPLWIWPLTLWLVYLAFGLRLWQAVLAAGLSIVVCFVGVMTLPEAQVVATLRLWVIMLPLLIMSSWTSAWMLQVMHDLQEARDAASWHATNTERARISRDLHDLFGQTLSTIAVKSELAAGLAARGKMDRAESEMREVHDIAEQSGEKVRAVVRGDRDLDLASELEGAQAVLQSAGISCTVRRDALPPEDVASTLAWVLREGVTNILRHSDASCAEIVLDDSGLTMRNDAPHPMSGVEGGLAGMEHRMREAGGTLEWRHEPEEFVLIARRSKEDA